MYEKIAQKIKKEKERLRAEKKAKRCSNLLCILPILVFIGGRKIYE
ncbi:hypothetical protein [Thermodesulfovibrio hydrogeniphilus]